MPAPKIEPRTRDKIIRQTEDLVETFTCTTVEPSVEALTGHILAQDVQGTVAGTFITADLAQQISQIEELSGVKVHGWLRPDTPIEVEPTVKTLTGCILNEDIRGEGQEIPKGTVISPELAEQISRIKGQVPVKVKLSPDAGSALIRIFGRFVELVVDRLNQVPEKNFLAFLNLIGADIRPPQPARVPLTFALAEGSPVDALVPAGTQVAAPPAEGEEEEVIFETDRDLVVTRAQLKSVFVRQPDADQYGDYTEPATGDKDSAFPAFSGDRPIEHSLYLACDDFFTLPAPKTITLTFDSSDASRLEKLPITWSYWDGMTWVALSLDSGIHEGLRFTIGPDKNQIEAGPGKVVGGEGQRIDLSDSQTVDVSSYKGQTVFLVISAGEARQGPVVQAIPETQASEYPAKTYLRLARLVIDSEGKISESVKSELKNGKWTVTIENMPAPTPRTLNGLEAGWLRARLDPSPVNQDLQQGLTPTEAQSQIEKITAQVKVERSGLAPDLALANSVPLDLSKDFYPFGEQPRFNDTFYLTSQEVFAKPGAQVTVKVKPSDPLPMPIVASSGLELAWEVLTGETWREVGRTTSSGVSTEQGDFKFTDTTKAFTNTEEGLVKFSLPAETKTGTVNGVTSYWLRVRITAGSYQKGAYDRPLIDDKGKEIKGTDGKTIYVQVPVAFTPPSLASLKLGYTYRTDEPRPLAACKTYNDFTYEDHTQTAAEANDIAFTLFKPSEDTQPALYLGFDRPFANRPMTLYARVDPLQPGESVERVTAEPARVIWEYAGPDEGWHHLGALDESNAFAKSGLIRFIGPADLTARAEFGQELYWLRARWQCGEFPVPPRLRRLLTNTTWATHATTIQNETLGSSTGQPNQVFRTTQAPLLLGQRLEVRELEVPSLAEREALLAREDEEAITVILDDAGRPEEVWVRWQPVPDFYGSGPRDRHYVLDRVQGEVRFGDGRHGMVPPGGRNNIRMALYRAGGGPQGNRPAETITQLKTTVPYVDSVTHLEAAHGGAEQESLAEVKERGPKTLRHRNRAVTAQDLEDLTYEASPNVVRVKSVAAQGAQDAGSAGLIIVPHSADPTDPRPTPSLELLGRVEDYIKARLAPTVDLWVAGPDWLRVTVVAEIVPVSLEAATNVQTAILSRLTAFLHPLRGGLDGTGWAFGRRPYRSDLMALIESTPDVDHVRWLTVTEEAEKSVLRPGRFLVYSGHHQISMVGGTDSDSNRLMNGS